MLKIPGRDIYCVTVGEWIRETLWCHVIIKLFKSDIEAITCKSSCSCGSDKTFDKQPETDDEWEELQVKRLKELPTWIIRKSFLLLKDTLSYNTKIEIVEAWKENNATWWASEHFGFGMSIRNLLREKVCLDDKLPSGNWDDYYTQMLEITVGVRNLNNFEKESL